MRLLVVDDDQNLSDAIAEQLKRKVISPTAVMMGKRRCTTL